MLFSFKLSVTISHIFSIWLAYYNMCWVLVIIQILKHLLWHADNNLLSVTTSVSNFCVIAKISCDCFQIFMFCSLSACKLCCVLANRFAEFNNWGVSRLCVWNSRWRLPWSRVVHPPNRLWRKAWAAWWADSSSVWLWAIHQVYLFSIKTTVWCRQVKILI